MKEGEQLLYYQCCWKTTMRENMNGNGTSFDRDYNKLSEEQKRCYHCSGLETQLECYFPNTKEAQE